MHTFLNEIIRRGFWALAKFLDLVLAAQMSLFCLKKKEKKKKDGAVHLGCAHSSAHAQVTPGKEFTKIKKQVSPREWEPLTPMTSPLSWSPTQDL